MGGLADSSSLAIKALMTACECTVSDNATAGEVQINSQCRKKKGVPFEAIFFKDVNMFLADTGVEQS